MLARVGNSLYWAGRYIERSDQTARYLNTNYFSSLDAPNLMSRSRGFVMESILFMVGGEFETEAREEDILYRVALDRKNDQSIFSAVMAARQNAHGTRHLISVEVWESINKYYHMMNSYSPKVFVKTGLFDLTTKVSEMCSIIREKIIRTMLHDEVWALLMLGVVIERALQTMRTINAKVYDVNKIIQEHPEIKDYSYEWATLLRCAEAFDMSKKYYKRMPDKLNTMEFLILNEQNPKSVISSLEKIKEYIYRISNKGTYGPESVEFKVGKLLAHFKYYTIEDISEDLVGFLGQTQEALYGIAESFEHDYLFIGREAETQAQVQ